MNKYIWYLITSPIWLSLIFAYFTNFLIFVSNDTLLDIEAVVRLALIGSPILLTNIMMMED